MNLKQVLAVISGTIRLREEEKPTREEEAAVETRAKEEAEAERQREGAAVYTESRQGKEGQSRQNSWLDHLFLAGAVLVLVVVSVLAGLDVSKYRRIKSVCGESILCRQFYGTPESESVNPGPEKVVDQGCPLGYCGARWLAKEDVVLYESPPPNPQDVDLSSLREAKTIRSGEWAVVQAGIVVAKRRQSGALRWAKAEDGTPVKPYQRLGCYSYLGGDRWRCWVSGHLAIVSGVAAEESTEDRWWVQLRAGDGAQAWTNSPQSFITQSELDKQLADTIGDKQLPYADKLAKADSLLKRGADINRTVKYFGVTPFSAAIGTRDLELLEALFGRGLDLQRGGCPAGDVAWVVTGPKGDLVLELLMKRNLQLGCLAEPALHSYLRIGIAKEDYPVEQAIRVARILIMHGVSLERRDSKGKTIIEALEQRAEYESQHPALRRNSDALVRGLLALKAR